MKYNFIEIGSSSYDTLLESADDNTIGLTVEPMQEHLDKLPNKPNIKKINAAIGDTQGQLDIYFFSPENIAKYNLGAWVNGCNMIGKPHPLHLFEIQQRNLPSNIIEKKQVPVITINDLFTQNDVTYIDYLKIDTEGYDTIIMYMYLEYIEKNPQCKAKKIQFESGRWVDQSDVSQIINRCTQLGYKLIQTGEDTILII